VKKEEEGFKERGGKVILGAARYEEGSSKRMAVEWIRENHQEKRCRSSVNRVKGKHGDRTSRWVVWGDDQQEKVRHYGFGDHQEGHRGEGAYAGPTERGEKPHARGDRGDQKS